MNKPGQWIEIEYSELQQLRDELADFKRAREADMAYHAAAFELLRKNGIAVDSTMLINAKNELLQERDELQAQVVVLRGALERARKGFVNLIDLNLLPSEEYEKDANKIAQCCFDALSDTPTEAAERVNGLVEALEFYEKFEIDIMSDEGEKARKALAAWRGQEN